MSDPLLGLAMLGLIVIVIMMGFPTAFTLMGLGMFFGFVAFYDPAVSWTDNRVFDLMVARTYGVMTNDTLLSIPLFVFMGYIIERAALVDKMFHSVQLAFRRLPGSLAVTTLLVCTFWGIASGIVGAVVVLMGVIALKPMLNAGYDTRLACGVITAGGTLGILIPPSVMIIVYAAVAGQSVVKLYAAAMFPGFFLAFLYLAYIIGWSMINPKVAPKVDPAMFTVKIPDWLAKLTKSYSRNSLAGLVGAALSPGKLTAPAPASGGITYGGIIKNLAAALFPMVFMAAVFGTVWWYVVIHNAPQTSATPAAVVGESAVPAPAAPPQAAAEKLEEMGVGVADSAGTPAKDEPLQEMGGDLTPEAAAEAAKIHTTQLSPEFFTYFWGSVIAGLLLLAVYYWRFDAEQLEILKMLLESVVPLAILTMAVLGVILFGITTATESAAVGALGAMYLAGAAKYPRRTLWATVAGAIIGVVVSLVVATGTEALLVSIVLGGLIVGTAVTWLVDLATRRALLRTIRESTFLTAKTTAMVCWLFIGSALFSAVFALHGGQNLIEKWVLGMDLSPLQFLLLSQAIIFFLGWPLEWTEIIVIFVPIFLPLLTHFNVDPILFATLVAVNLQAAFLSPPVAMSAFYLKGVAPPHVTLNQIFAGMMPYMLIVILCMVFMYIWPGMTLWLPNYLYGSSR